MTLAIDPPIYSGFSAATGFFGRIIGWDIRLFTGGDVNHAFYVFWSRELNAWMTIGANSNGVTQMSVAEFCETRTIKYLFEPIGWSIWAGLRAHVNDIDKHYNYLGLASMAHVEIVKKLTGRPGANLLDNRKDLFCSEWCAIVDRAGMGPARAAKLLPGYVADQVDPEDLCEASKKAPFFAPVPVPTVMRPYLLAA